MMEVSGKPVIMIGGGGHAGVVIDALRLLSIRVIGLVDPGISRGMHGGLKVPVLGSDDEVFRFGPEDVLLVNAIGSTSSTLSRRKVFQRFQGRGYAFLNVIHPTAVWARDIVVGEGSQLMAGAVIQTGTVVGVNVLINTASSIDHDCHIGDHVHIAPGVTLSGGVYVGEGTHLGTGAKVLQGVRIGQEAMIGVGVSVLADVEAGAILHPSKCPVWFG